MFFKERFRTLHKYLVEIEGLEQTFFDGAYQSVLRPPRIYDQTAGLVTEGIVRELPLCKHIPELLNQKIRFSYTETHATLEAKNPQVIGHIFVYPDYVIGTETTTVGQYISCEKIPLPKSKTGLIVPSVKRISHDTAKGSEDRIDEYYLDKGIVNQPNDHFPVGTMVYFKKPEFASHYWPHGMLIKHRNILAWGPDVIKMKYLPPFKQRKL